MRGASMMRNNKKSGGGMKHRHGNNNNRRYNNHGGGNSGGGRQSDQQNLARQKHHASQMRDKFQTLARDAQMSGERVDAEYYLQHVDHYMRVLADIAVIEAERFAHQREQQAANSPNEEGGEGSDAGENFTAEGEQGDAPQAAAPRQDRRPRSDNRSDNRGENRNRRPREHHAEAAGEPNPNDPRGPREIPLPASILSEIPASS